MSLEKIVFIEYEEMYDENYNNTGFFRWNRTFKSFLIKSNFVSLKINPIKANEVVSTVVLLSALGEKHNNFLPLDLT